MPGRLFDVISRVAIRLAAVSASLGDETVVKAEAGV